MSQTESTGVAIAPSGLVVAAIGFVLTRGTVVTGAESSAARFLVTGLVPLVLGMSLSAFGVALTVGSFSRPYVRRVAVWCLTGTVAMGAFVVLGTVGRSPDEEILVLVTGLGSDPLFSIVLIGSALGGTMTGIYSAQSVRQRDRLRYRTERTRVLNRLLRDRVLNAINVIQGQIELFDTSAGASPGQRGVEMLSDRSQAIEAVIYDVTYLVRGDGDDETVRPRSVTDSLATAVERARARYPVEDRTGDDYTVWAGGGLEQALYLAVAATADASGSPEAVTVEATEKRGGEVEVTVCATPTDRQGVVDPADDPEAGTKLELAGLTVGRYGGTVTTGTERKDGTQYSCVTVSLRRASAQPAGSESRVSGRYGVPIPRLAAVVVASLVAGVAMGVTMAATSGLVPVIGALYGFADPLVGWVTHLFHSVVFGVIYAGLLVAVPDTDRFAELLAVALALALGLWAVAAGVVMPLWLRFVGVPAPLPQLTVPSLLGHLVWGVTLATVCRLLSGPVTRWATDRRDDGS